MKIIVCVKEVLDPSAVNNYVQAGALKIGADGMTLEAAAVPRIINGYDEQALEAAARIRDSGKECHITAVTVGTEKGAMLRHCSALGADEVVAIDPEVTEVDGHVVANILSAYIRNRGGTDLILCGRQASDDDQGVTSALLAEKLGLPIAMFARSVIVESGKVRVTEVTPDGDRVVDAQMPVVVTVSNEIGTPRFPTAAAKLVARKKKPIEITATSLGLTREELTARVRLIRQFVPQVQGNCEFLEGAPAEVARQLVERLRAQSLI